MPADNTPDMVLVRRDDLHALLDYMESMDERRRLLAAVSGPAATVEYGAERPSPLYLTDAEFILDATFTYRENAESYVRTGPPYSRVVHRHVGPWLLLPVPEVDHDAP